jgi:hypothetical protein
MTTLLPRRLDLTQYLKHRVRTDRAIGAVECKQCLDASTPGFFEMERTNLQDGASRQTRTARCARMWATVA